MCWLSNAAGLMLSVDTKPPVHPDPLDCMWKGEGLSIA